VYYTSWCDEHGKVIDDGTVHGLDDGSFRWTAADPQLRWLRMNARGLDVEIEETTEATAAVALQGPLSRDVLELTGVPVIMNTSFNLKGEPIVESPAHAFNTFSLSGMDLLFLNNYVVEASAKKTIADTVFHLRHEGDSVTQMVS
jgi:hypothetical protein